MAVLGATSLTGCNSIPVFMPGTADVGVATATRTIFQNASAPTSWTKDTTVNEGMLRVTNGATLTQGGNQTFSQVFAASRTVSGTLTQNAAGITINQAAAIASVNNGSLNGGIDSGPTALGTPTMRSHTHQSQNLSQPAQQRSPGTANWAFYPQPTVSTGANGSGLGHVHTFPGGAHTHTLPLAFSQYQHSHTVSGQHQHSWSTTWNAAINYVDMIICRKD